MGKRLIVGQNDMATTHPELAKQWDSVKNGPTSPCDVIAGTHAKFWWVCDFNHSWQASGDKRVGGKGCPVCSNKVIVAGVNDLATTNPDLALELHPTKNGVLTARSVSAGTNKRLWWLCAKGHEFEKSGNQRLSRSSCPFCANQSTLQGYNDLATTHPELAKQWDAVKNGPTSPCDVIAGTHAKFWWVCDFNHSWQASGDKRVGGQGCPVCSNKVIVAGVNDLATTNPELISEWHESKNLPTLPQQVVAGSHKKFWWKCVHGHAWQASVVKRVGGQGCSVCANRLVVPGVNDLATTNPVLASELHPTKNGALTANSVSAGTNRKLWWVCAKGHEFSASGDGRALRLTGCPVCANQKLLVGFNDLATTNPDLALQWHGSNNGNLRASDVLPGTNKKYWWKCLKGHEWQSAPTTRIRTQSGCPVCANKAVLPGLNDLATTHPELADEWHKEKNGPLSPKDVIAGSHKRVWWKCNEGHVWLSSLGSRAAGRGCPTCAQHGFDPNKPATLYFLSNRSLYARKVGITNQGTARLNQFDKAGWKKLMTVDDASGQLVKSVESALLNWLRVEHALPQQVSRDQMRRTGGWTETFSDEGPSDFEIMERIRFEFKRLSTETN